MTGGSIAGCLASDSSGTAKGNPDSYNIETETFTFTNPTRPGYSFTGWSGTGLTGEKT